MWEDDDEPELPGTGMDTFFSRAFAEMSPFFEIHASTTRPLFKMEVAKDSVTVTLDLPGVKKEDIEITCTEDFVNVEARLTKGAEAGRRVTSYERYSGKIMMPIRVDPDKATAKHRNGMVVITLPILHTGKAIKIVDG